MPYLCWRECFLFSLAYILGLPFPHRLQEHQESEFLRLIVLWCEFVIFAYVRTKTKTKVLRYDCVKSVCIPCPFRKLWQTNRPTNQQTDIGTVHKGPETLDDITRYLITFMFINGPHYRVFVFEILIPRRPGLRFLLPRIADQWRI